MNHQWSLMQDIEAMRHLAELLEARAEKASTRRRDVYTTVAAQLRCAAERVYELAQSED